MITHHMAMMPTAPVRTDRLAAGALSQLMWRRTSDVGCALARGREEDVLVCRYSRAGNVFGQQPF